MIYADYAQRLGEKWGIGKKQLNNGVLILVKPKQPGSDGKVFIAQGYGLEGVLPDLTCSQIVDNDILPAFRTGNYYGGLDKAVNSVMSITHGEFTAEEYGSRASKSNAHKDTLWSYHVYSIYYYHGYFQGVRRIQQEKYKYRRIAILDAAWA